jgi:methylphosphotriester-DNA--protein-cysteine methyltransferase
VPLSTLADLERLRGLVATVGAFYVRDRALERAQKEIERALAAGGPDATAVRAYLAAVERYFSGFHREAQAQLKYVDRELERLYQRQFNLTAERGVAARRVEATQGVLSSLAELAAS